MDNRLLSDEYPNSIGGYIHNSEHFYINREFEYIHEFELKCLEKFNLYKSHYESLEIWEKDEVINYWKEQCDWYFEEEVTFSPDNIKKFDLLTFYEIDSNDYRYNELENTDPYPTFYRNYYILKFRKLLINFFFFEEYCNLKSLEIVNYVKPEFNPYEFLDLEMPVGVFPNIEKPDGLPGVSQKFKGHLFWLFNELEIVCNSHSTVKAFCIEQCASFNTEYSDYVRQMCIEMHPSDRLVFKSQVFPYLKPEVRGAIETHLNKLSVRK